MYKRKGSNMKKHTFCHILLPAAALVLAFGAGMSAQAAPVIMPDGYLFDPEYYAENNPDVTAAFGDDPTALYQHFKKYGAKEGRLPWDPYANIDITTVPHYGRAPVQDANTAYHTIEEKNDGEVTLTFAGDVNLEPSYCGWAAAKNGLAGCFDAGVLSDMRDADFFVFNNEFTYTRAAKANTKTYTFKADPAFTRQLSDIGTDLVTLANNHTYDYLEQGLLDTLDNLKAAGIPTIGAGRNLSEAEAPYYAKAGNTTLAIISTTRIEGYQNPPTRGATSTSAGVFRCLDPTELLRVVKEAKTKADLVIVYVHWGTEKRATPDANQLALAKQLEAAGCDAVIGDHSHCLETLGYVNDMPVVYSLGNYLFSQNTRSTCLYRLTVNTDEGTIKSTQFVPVTTSNGTYLRTPDAKTKASMLSYMRSLSPQVSIDREGFVTKKQ